MSEKPTGEKDALTDAWDRLSVPSFIRDELTAVVAQAWDEGWWKGQNDHDPTVLGYADNPYRVNPAPEARRSADA